MKDREMDNILSDTLSIAKKNDVFREQQLILLWLLFITASIGFMF